MRHPLTWHFQCRSGSFVATLVSGGYFMKLNGAINRLGVCAATALVTALVACGGEETSEFNGKNPNDPNSWNGSDEGSGTFNGGGAGVGADLQACATSVSDGKRIPVQLVFMYDKSGSMGQAIGGSSVTKWKAVKDGIKAFAVDPKSEGISASLAFFSGGTGSNSAECNAGAFTKLDVESAQLPAGGASISNTVDAYDKRVGGMTPSVFALASAEKIAASVKSKHPSERAVIVFVTDGIPQGCWEDRANKVSTGNTGLPASLAVEAVQTEDGKNTNYSYNSIGNVSKIATQANAAGFSTYVVGVGDQLTNLNAIAASGGTQSAFIVPANDPSQASAKLVQALNAIRGQVGSCSFSLPAPPAGQTLDPKKVNVAIAGQTINYSGDCAGMGWKYDNASNPTRVDLCPATCEEVKKAASANVSIAFGCATKGGDVF
ncbi:MAG: VWA domain-containing protein [Polyangiaceae bacterium]|nr:VWA domain-containing protein [Polyangiaceae bacterium]